MFYQFYCLLLLITRLVVLWTPLRCILFENIWNTVARLPPTHLRYLTEEQKNSGWWAISREKQVYALGQLTTSWSRASCSPSRPPTYIREGIVCVILRRIIVIRTLRSLF